MSSLITVNQTNVLTGRNNAYQYTFPSGSARFKDSEIAVASIVLPYSWYNITTDYNNQTLSLVFPVTNGVATTTVAITIPDGFYTIEQLNAYLQSIMIANGFYLVDASGDNVYYIEIVANAQLSIAQLNSYIVPTSVPVGWTNPGSWALPSAGSRVPQLVTDTSSFSDIIGFAKSTSFPSTMTQSGTYSVTSSFQPQISPVSSILLGCNLVNNVLSSPNNIICAISINNTFGSQITFDPNEYIWLPVLDGQYPWLQLQFYDQFGNQLQMTDTNTSILLITRTKKTN